MLIAYRLRWYFFHRCEVERVCIRKEMDSVFLSSLETMGKEISDEIKLENVENVE
jgi:hypothetical protein